MLCVGGNEWYMTSFFPLSIFAARSALKVVMKASSRGRNLAPAYLRYLFEKWSISMFRHKMG